MTLPPAKATEHTRRVLVVDDDEVARGEFARVLADAGYQVAEAWSVVQAMRLLLSFRPHAVVLDLILPDGHGIEVGRAMNAIVTTRDTCVVAVTANPGSVSLADPPSFGARRILLKPLDRETLLSAIEQCFEPAGADVSLTLPLGPALRPDPV